MQETSIRRKCNRGFTLIELMIVLLILGVIAAIAYPSYTSSVSRSNRSAVKATLMQLQVAQERWRASNPAYTNVLANLGTVSAAVQLNYAFAFVAGPTTYSITATAIGTQLANDGACSPISINQDGPVTPNAAARVCWAQ